MRWPIEGSLARLHKIMGNGTVLGSRNMVIAESKQ